MVKIIARLFATLVALIGFAIPSRATTLPYKLNGIDVELKLVRKDWRGDLELGELRAPWTLPLPGGSMTLPKGSAIKAEAIDKGSLELRLLTAAAPEDIWVEMQGVRMLVRKRTPISFLTRGNIPDSITAARDFTARLAGHDIPFAAKKFGAAYARVRGEPTVVFHENGSIREGWVIPSGFDLELADNPIHVEGDSLPEFYEEGELKEARINSGTYRIGPNTVELARMHGRGSTGFHRNGGIASAGLAHESALKIGARHVRFRAELDHDRMPYASSPFFGLPTIGNIGFHDNGAVMYGVLAEPTAFDETGNTPLAADQYVFFDREGRLIQPPLDQRPRYLDHASGSSQEAH